ncbi:MAG: amidohydrolase [Bacteroidetes bacterium]|nr:amidohydrolase [Bacteroidota bacterium]
MKNFFRLLSVCCVLLSACTHKQSADLIVHNAVIYTVDSSFSTAQSIAVKDGKFIAVGTNEEILSAYEAKEMIDAKGNALYPGLIDSHCHFYGYGEGLQQVNLVGTRSFDEVIARITSYSKEHPDVKWIIGRGWDQNDWTVKEFPDRKKLDSLFPSTPVFIERIDGHAALANGEAMRRANITGWKRVDGGRIGSYLDLAHMEIAHVAFASLNGILIDNAVDLVKKVIPKPTKEEIRTALLAAQKNCFAVGLTTVDDAGLEKHIVDAMDEAQKSGTLKMRIYAMLTDNKENADYYLNKGIYKTDRLNVRSFKFYADGALGSRGACLLQPYSDKPDQRGFLLSSPEHFDSLAHLAMLKMFQVNTHCIGDSAVRLIIAIDKAAIGKRAIIESHNHVNGSQMRPRIEHFQVSTKEDLASIQNSGIIPSVQPTHATSDMYWAQERLGPERIKYAYAYNDLLKAAGMLALGTDFPVENINPMYTFYAAVARKDLKGFPEGGFQPENALSRENTLRGMTIWGAYANFEEQEKGSIEKGKLADFVILDKDIMKCAIDSVPKVQVIYTFVNGERVYSSK